MAVTTVRRTAESREGSSEPATTLRMTAPIPRSVKGMRPGKEASSPYWAQASGPKWLMMRRVLIRPKTPATPMTTILATAVRPTEDQAFLRCRACCRACCRASSSERGEAPVRCSGRSSRGRPEPSRARWSSGSGTVRGVVICFSFPFPRGQGPARALS